MKRHYIIPMNFMESGYVMDGAVSVRNLVEAGVMALIGFFICRWLPLPAEWTDAITYYILIIAPLAMLGLYGVQGDPLSVFILDFLKWSRRRKPCFYNTHSEAYMQEAADMLMDAPQFRDMLADALDKVRQNMSGESVDYVEGKTFRFEQDPEQEALKQAQEDFLKKREEELAAFLADKYADAPTEPQKQNPFGKTDDANAVDAKKVSQMIVLDKLDWEEDS